MKRYRLLFFDASACLYAGHWFHAREDEQARWIAQQLHDACSDVCPSFELRQGSREVERGGPVSVPRRLEEMSERRQQLLTFHEEVLLDSVFRIEESRRLLDRLREVKGL